MLNKVIDKVKELMRQCNEEHPVSIIDIMKQKPYLANEKEVMWFWNYEPGILLVIEYNIRSMKIKLRYRWNGLYVTFTLSEYQVYCSYTAPGEIAKPMRFKIGDLNGIDFNYVLSESDLTYFRVLI